MSRPILPPFHAEMNKARAGQKYRPSNGNEGCYFWEAWCRNCQRDSAMREGADFDECDDDQKCDLIALTCLHEVTDPEYPVQWQYGADGQPCCTAYVPAGETVPSPRCTATMELF